MKFKKIIFCAGFISTGLFSVLHSNKVKYEKKVETHVQEMNHNANIIAHRGFSSLELENSFKSVDLAFDCNCCDGVEIDVRLSKDNEVVLAHDEKLFGVGKVKNKTLDELKEKKYVSKISTPLSNDQVKTILSKDSKLVVDRNKELDGAKEHICTLNEIVDEINSKKILLVDLKFDKYNDEKLYEKINDIFDDYEGDLDIIFQSTDYKRLLEMKNKYSNYKYQIIIKKERDLKYIDKDFDYYCIRKNLISYDLVKELIDNNKKVCIWTINSYSDFKSLSKELDVYLEDIYIITDYPDEMCYLFNKKINEGNKKYYFKKNNN